MIAGRRRWTWWRRGEPDEESDMASSKAKAPAKPRARKKKGAEPGSRGLTPAQVAEAPPDSLTELQGGIVSDGGRVLAAYRDPVGGHWHVLAALPLDRVAPTPYQRDLSETHAKRLTDVIGKLDRFLDPIIVVRGGRGAPPGTYWTPNGNHRRAALASLGARSVIALVVPDAEVAYQILALNTEKAHNLREKSLEVVRMARALAEIDPRAEKDYALQFEEPSLITLGLCYEQRGRFAGGAYNPVLKRVDAFMEHKLPKSLETRAGRAAVLLELDDAVNAAVAALKERGFQSAYLKAFVVARVNPIRFVKGGEARDHDETIAKMLASAKKFDVSKVKADQVAAASGPPEE
jgi:ParB family chromosome partitioning protein